MTKRSDAMKIDLRHNKGDFESNVTGDLSRITGLENLKQALMHRLLTVQGTLAHRPDYGVGVKLWQNALTSLEKKRELATRIDEQFRRDPRVNSVSSVRFVVSDTEPDKFFIFVKYSAIGYNDLEDSFDPFELGDI